MMNIQVAAGSCVPIARKVNRMATEQSPWIALSRALFTPLERPVQRYAAGLAIFFLALALRFAILPINGGIPFLTFFTAVTITALLCGTGPALMVIVLGSLSANYIFMAPYWAITYTPGAISAMAVFALSGLLICMIVHRNRKEESARALLAAVVASSENAIMSKTIKGIITSWNPAAERLFGYTAAEAMGKPMTILFPPDRLDEEAELLARVARGERITRYETKRLRKDGSKIDVSVTLSPIYDRMGSIVGVSKIAHDITERRALEERERQSNRQLLLATKELKRSNQELDEFARVASHDLKEPLRGIHNYVSFLLEDYAGLLDEQGRNYLASMQRLAARMAALIDSLLDYSRLGSAPLAMEAVNLDEVLDEVAEDLKLFLIDHGVELRRPTRLPMVTGNAIRLGELFQNLITNGAKFNDKPEKWVEVGCDNTKATPVFLVRDNGIGIPQQHQKSVFGIFKRLHAQDKYGGGTGAGLTVAKKIVERHGGRIWLESTPGEGTTFFFTLAAGLTADSLANGGS
jgi:PAS domain S-box-containing protein